MARRPLTVPTSGTLAFAEDYGDNPTPLAVWVTPDGAAVGGPGAWQQLAVLVPQAYAANWTVTDWYLDGTVGNDANNGTTALTPLRTGAELLRRLGPYALWGQSVTVHVLVNGMTDALVLRGVMLVAGTHLDVIGTPTQVADAGTITAVTGIDHLTPQAPTLTTSLIPDWTAYVGKRLTLTSSSNVGATSWIAKANPSALGLNVARTPRWARASTTSTTTLGTTITPAVGTSIVVESLPFVPSIDILVDGQEQRTAGVAQYPQRVVTVSSIACPLMAIRGRAVSETARVMILSCNVGYIEAPPGCAPLNSGFGIWSCQFAYPVSSSPTAIFLAPSTVTSCLFGAPLTTVYPGANGTNALINCLFQGVSVVAINQSTLTLTDVQIFDVVGAGSSALSTNQCSVGVGSVSGSGNAGYGYSLSVNTSFYYFGTQNLQGAVSNARLSTAPAINLTIPQLLQPSDYAQKGVTPAMVAGTTTVTVPWYSNTTQRVTVSHAVFGGTPGILSVQQISTTQFTITSSNALDTSTVNWAMSPLGRNIFISTV